MSFTPADDLKDRCIVPGACHVYQMEGYTVWVEVDKSYPEPNEPGFSCWTNYYLLPDGMTEEQYESDDYQHGLPYPDLIDEGRGYFWTPNMYSWMVNSMDRCHTDLAVCVAEMEELNVRLPELMALEVL